MDATTARREAIQRMYRWAAADMMREIDLDFPLFRRIPSIGFEVIVAMMLERSDLDRRTAGVALTSSLFSSDGWYEIDGLDIDIDKEFKECGHRILSGWMDRFARASIAKKPKKKELASVMLERIVPIAGVKPRRLGGLEWDFEWMMDDWRIWMDVEVADGLFPGSAELRFLSSARRSDFGGDVPTIRTLAGIFGYGRSWEIWHAGDIEPAADTFAEVSANILRALPSHFESLNIED